jgi:predicted ATPase
MNDPIATTDSEDFATTGHEFDDEYDDDDALPNANHVRQGATILNTSMMMPPPPQQPSNDDSAPVAVMDQRLYGRESEQQVLLRTYSDMKQGKGRLIIVRGGAGSGKSSLVQATLRPAVTMRDGGYYLTGKFSHLQEVGAYDIYRQAFIEYVAAVLERGPDVIERVRITVTSTLLNEVSVLTELIPELGLILGTGTANAENEPGDTASLADTINKYGSSEAVHRLKYIFRMFLRAIASVDHPVVLVLDDLHWADEASLTLFQSLVSDTVNTSVLFVGIVRDNTAGIIANRDSNGGGSNKKPRLDSVDEYANAPYHRCIKELVQAGQIKITTVSIQNLEEAGVNEMLTDMLGATDPSETKPLTTILYKQTEGKIFFILEMLRELQAKGLLLYDDIAQRWTYNVTKIQLVYHTLPELVKAKVEELSPPEAAETIKIAACLGAKIDETCLRHVVQIPITPHLKAAAAKGLIVLDNASSNRKASSNSVANDAVSVGSSNSGGSRTIRSGGFSFAHDEVQEAVYHLIAETEREQYHYRIGKTLASQLAHSPAELDKYIFIIVGQLMLCSAIIVDQAEKYDTARLMLRVGERAIQLNSFQTAHVYILHGITLLGSDSWLEEYELSLNLFSCAAEVAYCNNQFDSVQPYVETVFRHARNFNDTLRVQTIRVYALGSAGHVPEAIRVGLEVLRDLHCTFPESPTMAHVTTEMRRLAAILEHHSDDKIVSLPSMTDTHQLAVMQMLNVTYLYAFSGQLELAPLIGFRMLSLTLEHGVCPVSCVGFVVLAMLLCGVGEDINAGYRFGRLGIRLYEKFDTKAWLGRVSAAYYGCVHGWKKPIQEALEPLKYAHRVGLETGDIEFAMLNSNIYCCTSPASLVAIHFVASSCCCVGAHSISYLFFLCSALAVVDFPCSSVRVTIGYHTTSRIG